MGKQKTRAECLYHFRGCNISSFMVNFLFVVLGVKKKLHPSHQFSRRTKYISFKLSFKSYSSCIMLNIECEDVIVKTYNFSVILGWLPRFN